MPPGLARHLPGSRGFCARLGLMLAMAALYLAMALPGHGRALQFPAFNVRCDLPDDWAVVQGKNFLVHAESPFETQGFIMGYQRAPLSATLDDPQYIQDLQDGFAKGSQGVVTNSGYVVMNNIRYFFFDAKAEHDGVTNYFHNLFFLGNGMMYSFSILKADDNPTEDEQLMSILQSCDFIQAPTPHTGVLTIWDIFHPVDQKPHSTTERFVYALETCGQVLLVFLFPLFFYLGLTVLFYRLLFKKGRAAPPPPAASPVPPAASTS